MKILLIRPPRMKQSVIIGEFMFSEPIGLEMVAAMLQPEHDVTLFDMMADSASLQAQLKKINPQVVGITSLCIDVAGVLSIAREVKEANANIITLVGGTQATLDPEAFFHPAVDHVFQYTTTQNVTRLMNLLEEGDGVPLLEGVLSRCHQYRQLSGEPTNEYRLPDRSITAHYRHQYSYFGYRPCAIMGTARGCSKACHFCLRWRLEGCQEVYFPMEQVQEDILSIEEGTIMIFDNDFLHNPDRVNEICDFLEEKNIRKNWICYASVHSILGDRNAVTRFHRLGLKAVLVGYETFRDDELITYNKKTRLEDHLACSVFLKDLGLDVWASFMAHPDWTQQDFSQFRRYIRKLNPEITSISPLTPFPSLPLYKTYQDRLLYKKEEYWAWSFGQVMIRPSKMSLRQYYWELLKTNLYVNVVCNSLPYVIRKFGWASLLRLTKGSVVLTKRYVGLMLGSR